MEYLNQQFNRQPRGQTQSQTWWQQTTRARYWFLAGLLIGVLFGWFFHGVVSIFVRLGFLVLLLIPLIVIGWLFLRSRRGPEEEQSGSRVFTFGNLPFGQGPPDGHAADPFSSAPPRRDQQPVIDLNDDDYDLERFKRKLEQER